MKIRSYTIIQLKDLIGDYGYEPYSHETSQGHMENIDIAGILGDFHISYEWNPQSDLFEDLFTKLNNRFVNYCIFEIATDEASEEVIQAKMREWLVKFINEYENTRTYYETLIKKLNAVKDHLMDDIEATNENEVIFNDTPQTSGGVFKTTDYATTYTKTSSKSKTPMKTPIERLKDLQDNLLNLWKDWSNQFHQLFIETQEGSYYD